MILQINLMYLWRKNYQKEDYDFNSLTKQRLRIGLLFRKTKTLGRKLFVSLNGMVKVLLLIVKRNGDNSIKWF